MSKKSRSNERLTGSRQVEVRQYTKPKITVTHNQRLTGSPQARASQSKKRGVCISVRVTGFWLPKAGHSEEEYEDALQIDKVQAQSYFQSGFTHELKLKKLLRFAIADGATESSFSRLWASLLVEAYTHVPFKDINKTNKLLENFEEKGKEWFEKARARSLPWYAERKVQQGAFSTILGLLLRNSEREGRIERTWDAFAIGDSCLFHIQKDQVCTSFPIDTPDQFNQHPLLLSSLSVNNAKVRENQEKLRKSGKWQRGDIFFLMTDALAEWFLKKKEEWLSRKTKDQLPPWDILRNLETYGQKSFLSDESSQDQEHCIGSFQDLIQRLRESKEIRNDDVTLLIIQV